MQEVFARYEKTLHLISAATGEGKQELVKEIAHLLKQGQCRMGDEGETEGFSTMSDCNIQLTHKARILEKTRRIVVKVGSSVLSDGDGVYAPRVRQLATILSTLRQVEVVLVTSGAVAAGMGALNMKQRPRTIPAKQAAAAIGQITLMALYEECFSQHAIRVAQILLTHDDLANRRRYLNAKHTLLTLIESGVVPIVNENDTVAVEEIQFGDNDNLSAQVAVLVEADLLIILSDVAGLYETDPRLDQHAKRIALVERFRRTIDAAVRASWSAGPRRDDL